jgi:hypothetical protein
MESYKVVSDQSVLIGETVYNQHAVVQADPTDAQVQALIENGQIEVFTPEVAEAPAEEVVEAPVEEPVVESAPDEEVVI